MTMLKKPKFISLAWTAMARYGWLYVLLLLGFALAPSCVGDLGTVEVDPAEPGARIPDDFLGISVEWSRVLDYLGDSTGGVRPTTVTLLRAFEAEEHHVAVRIGGNSQDRAWWNPQGVTPPPGVTLDLGPAHLSTLAALVEVLHTRLVLGLNLALGDSVLAADLVEAVYGTIPREAIQAFELGNEPDLYRFNGRRGLDYDWSAYLPDMEAFRDGIAARVSPAPPFAAPAIAYRFWLRNLGDLFALERNRLALVTTHVYPFTSCANLAPSPENLLTDCATSRIGARYTPIAAAAHAAGLAHRMDETNSVSCGGADGVSNAYVAALRGADLAFQLATAGLDGLNFHTPGEYYAAFLFDPSGAPVVQPLYYGMRFFSLATARHGRLLPVVVATPAHVHAWATLGEDGAVRVALINLDLARGGVISLRLLGRSGVATLVRLCAPALDARDGLTLGGQTWDGSVDGRPLGTAVSEPVAYDTGAYRVPLPALEAVVVTVAPAP